MANEMAVSIVVNNYNYGAYVGAAIESALRQTHPDVEVVVVDDGSTDGSRDVIAGFEPRIVPILKDNGGQASALNAGFEAARGDVVIFLDSDDMLCSSAVARCAREFDSDKVVKVHWPLWRVDSSGNKTGGVVPDHSLVEGDLRDLIIDLGPETVASPPNSPPTSGNAWSRHFLSKVLPIPEMTYRFGADSYLLNLAGIYGTIRAIQQPLGCYRVHGMNDTLKPFEHRAKEFLIRYEHCRVALAEHLNRTGVDLVGTCWLRDTWYHRIAEAMQHVEMSVPSGAAFILVDDNQWQADELIGGRNWLPFLEREGQYWGPPVDDAEAIREIERLRASGWTYVVFAWPSFWWLDYYCAFRRHLEAHYRLILSTARVRVFQLST
jgi:glycosyltransferase involved in cell wall biosynthesis